MRPLRLSALARVALGLALAWSVGQPAFAAGLPAAASPTLAAHGLLATPPPTRPVTVHVRLWAYDIGRVDLKEGTCAFDGSVELLWPPGTGPRASDPRPFEIMNAVEAHIEDYGAVLQAGKLTQSFRVHATLRLDVDLQRYPFDTQHLTVQLEHPLWTLEHFRMVADSQADPKVNLRRDRLGHDVRLRDWNLVGVRDGTSEVIYAAEEHFSRYQFAVDVRRSILPFLVGDLVPIALMVLLGLGATFLPGKALDAKLLLTVLALLVAVELQVGGAERMPRTGYLLLSDWMYVLSYLSISLTVAHAIIEHRLTLADRLQAARRVRWWGFAVAAAVFFVPVALMMATRA